MNTRLQVEHPVTECVYGVDLVRLQLEIAEGAPLPTLPPSPVGHAIEVRLYAENPAQDWRPQSGRLHRFDIPGVDAEFGLGGSLRVDSGVVGGSRIGVHYDPMLAKVISFGATRAEAARRLSTALARTRIHGLTTNRDLLVHVLRHPRFLSGETDTGFLDRHPLTGPLADPAAVRISALAAALAWAAANRAGARVLGGVAERLAQRGLPAATDRICLPGRGRLRAPGGGGVPADTGRAAGRRLRRRGTRVRHTG